MGFKSTRKTVFEIQTWYESLLGAEPDKSSHKSKLENTSKLHLKPSNFLKYINGNKNNSFCVITFWPMTYELRYTSAIFLKTTSAHMCSNVQGCM